jgi:hypothetical protein
VLSKNNGTVFGAGSVDLNTLQPEFDTDMLRLKRMRSIVY